MKKFILSSQQLKQALHKVGTVIMPKSVLPALANICCEAGEGYVQMIASDLETTIMCTVDCETTEAPFKFLLPFALISKIVSLSKEAPLTFEVWKTKLKITAEDGLYELNHLEKVENFPKLPNEPTKDPVTINKDIIRLLKVASQTTGKDEKKPYLMKVLMELRSDKTTIASSDGSYMVFSQSLPLASSADGELLLSNKVIKAIEDMESAKVCWNEKTIAFSNEKTTVLVTRSEEKFPNFRALFPVDYESNVTLDRYAVINALEKCNINSDALKEMTINLEWGDKVAFDAKDKDFGININVEVPGRYSGATKNIKSSSEKMLKLINQVNSENISMAIHGEDKPILFRNDDEGYTALLMPLRN